jgi:CRP/FNR family cyclic AMP-dependent transcriptional regulator
MAELPFVTVARRSPRSVCRVLREDRGLAQAIPVAGRQQAIDECIARRVRIASGRWSAQRADVTTDGIGLLVLEGLLIRRVGVDGRFGAELLGDADLLRPWQGADMPPTLPRTTGWRALPPTAVAVLDALVAQRLARYPELTGQLVARALERSRNLAVNMAIVHQPRVDFRLQMLFWHLADRRGPGTQRRDARAATPHPPGPCRPRRRAPPNRLQRPVRARPTRTPTPRR